MSQVVTPAPLWRRLIAAVYDGLLLLALWLVVGILDFALRSLFGLPQGSHGLVLIFGVGLAFHGWFWTHGGQTLGGRSWRLQVRRDDGQPLRWPVAALRYTLGWLSWFSVLGMLWCLFDTRRRALHDLLTNTEVIVLPKG